MRLRIVSRRWLAGYGLLISGFACVLALVLGHAPAPAAAQGSLVVEKTLLKDTNVVRVGETLTFAITITNNWNTTVITLPVIDNFDPSVLRFIDATPGQDTLIQSTGVISWNNVLAGSGPLAPGQRTVIYVRFLAEHPAPRVVNRARTHDAYDSSGSRVGDGNANQESEAIGGRTPMTKTLDMANQPMVGALITFTITIGNDGAADVVNLPIRDVFDPAALQFVRAVPPIDGESPGVIVWSNVLRSPLPTMLRPGEVVRLTVVFTALRELTQTTNRVETVGARDEFGNDLAAAADDVPIRIIAGPNATATATPRPTPRPSTPRPATPEATTSAPTAVADASATPATSIPALTETPAAGGADTTPIAGGINATPTRANQPTGLPDTGGTSDSGPLIAILALALLLLGVGGHMLRQRAATDGR